MKHTKLGSITVSHEDGVKLLKLDLEDCITLIDWFKFVDAEERITEDYQFNTKIHAAHKIMSKQTDYEFVIITPREAYLAHQWYIRHCPKGLADRRDLRMDAILSAFVERSME